MTRNTQPIIVLVEPQLGANIGMCARAMLNCGLCQLRLVKPREEWPNESAIATAADADVVLEQTRVFSSLTEAVEDCHRVIATTARERADDLPVVLPEEASQLSQATLGVGQKVAILFGPEASGLDNSGISIADTLLRFPTNPDFPSLNLAQAVLLFGWEWKKVADVMPSTSAREMATRGDVAIFMHRLEEKLETAGFFLTPELKPNTVRVLQTLFSRMQPSDRELKLLHGILTSLTRTGSGLDGDDS